MFSVKTSLTRSPLVWLHLPHRIPVVPASHPMDVVFFFYALYSYPAELSINKRATLLLMDNSTPIILGFIFNLHDGMSYNFIKGGVQNEHLIRAN